MRTPEGQLRLQIGDGGANSKQVYEQNHRVSLRGVAYSSLGGLCIADVDEAVHGSLTCASNSLLKMDGLDSQLRIMPTY